MPDPGVDRAEMTESIPRAGRPIGPAERLPEALPLESMVTSVEGGWVVRLPVRAESVTVRKVPVVYERLVMRTQTTVEMTELTETVRREELEIESAGERIIDKQRGPTGR